MYISINDTQNYTFCRLQLVVETFGQSTNNEPTDQNVPKNVKLMNKTLGTSVIKSPMSPSSLKNIHIIQSDVKPFLF